MAAHANRREGVLYFLAPMHLESYLRRRVGATAKQHLHHLLLAARRRPVKQRVLFCRALPDAKVDRDGTHVNQLR